MRADFNVLSMPVGASLKISRDADGFTLTVTQEKFPGWLHDRTVPNEVIELISPLALVAEIDECVELTKM